MNLKRYAEPAGMFLGGLGLWGLQAAGLDPDGEVLRWPGYALLTASAAKTAVNYAEGALGRKLKLYEKVPLVAMSVLGMSGATELWERYGTSVTNVTEGTLPEPLSNDTEYAGRGSVGDIATTTAISVPLMLAREYAGSAVNAVRDAFGRNKKIDERLRRYTRHDQ